MASPVEVASRLSAVVELQQEILASVTDPQKVMELVVAKTPDATGGTGAALGLLHHDDLVFRAVSGLATGRIGYCIPLEGSLTGHAVRQRAVMRCNNTLTDTRVDGEAARDLGLRSVMVAPLYRSEEVIGALITFSAAAEAFDDLDAYTLQVLAGITSSALMQAREFRDRQASEQRYRMLFEKNIAGVFRSTPEGRILDCNDALVTYLGYDSRDDLCAHEAWELYLDRADRQRLVDSAKKDSGVRNARINFRKKDGTPMVGIISITAIPTDEGDTHLLGTLVEDSPHG